MNSSTEILRALVAIPSVSSLTNRPIIEAATRILASAGWTAQFHAYRDPGGTEKLNLVARPGHQSGPEVALALVCHTDTVPFNHEAWPEATTLEERDGNLHGCGACDVKGSLAAILAAIAQTPVSKIERSAALVLTADEEIGCIGATYLLASPPFRARSAIICEPTSLRPAVAGKGYGLAEMHIRGREAHSAFPNQGASAIYAAAKMALAIKDHMPAATNALFDPPHTTFNIGTIHGGTAKNIISGECRFLVEWRPIPNEDPKHALTWLQQLAAATQTESPGCTIEVIPQRAEPGFAYPSNSPLLEILVRHLQQQPIGISFGSEATRFARIAGEVMVLGPGNMHTAHSNRECIPIRELEAFTACIAKLLTARE